MQNTTFRRMAQILWWLGAALTVTGLILKLRPILGSFPSLILTGAGIAAVGVSILLGGDIIAGPAPRQFSARGQVVRGNLSARAGLSNLTIQEGPADRIASVSYGPWGKPGFDVETDIARLRLGQNPLQPNLSRWHAGLATNILWDIHTRSSLGDITLNLENLRLEHIEAKTALGRIDLRCPARGYVEVDLRTTLGTIYITLPPEIGIHITTQTGRLGSVVVKNKRLLASGQQHFTTPDFDTAAAQVIIHAAAGAGEIIIA